MPIRQLMQKAGSTSTGYQAGVHDEPAIDRAISPTGSVSFDVVIFDEASQVRPVDAFGALLRGASGTRRGG